MALHEPADFARAGRLDYPCKNFCTRGLSRLPNQYRIRRIANVITSSDSSLQTCMVSPDGVESCRNSRTRKISSYLFRAGRKQ